jgi:hypothetical protein
MNTRKYVLKLTAEERTWLEAMVGKGKAAAWKMRHAHALLKMDQGEDGPGWDDARIAEAFGMTTRSLETWRKRAVEEGPHARSNGSIPRGRTAASSMARVRHNWSSWRAAVRRVNAVAGP